MKKEVQSILWTLISWNNVILQARFWILLLARWELGNGRSQRIHCQRQRPRKHNVQGLVPVIQKRTRWVWIWKQPGKWLTQEFSCDYLHTYISTFSSPQDFLSTTEFYPLVVFSLVLQVFPLMNLNILYPIANFIKFILISFDS